MVIEEGNQNRKKVHELRKICLVPGRGFEKSTATGKEWKKTLRAMKGIPLPKCPPSRA